MDIPTMLHKANQLGAIELYQMGQTHVTVGRLLVAGSALLATFVVSKLIQRSITRALRKQGVHNRQTILTSRRLAHFLVMLLGLGLSLKIAGIDLSALFAAGAVVTVGLGFAMQNIAQNFVSGIILFVERTIQPDDIVQVDDKVVQIQKVGIRSTLAITRRGEELIIPNSNLVQGTVINYTMSNRSYLMATTVGVAYESNMDVVKTTLHNAAADMPWRVANGEVRVLLREFGDSSINFEVLVEIDNPFYVNSLRSELNGAIWEALKEAGITIAFPQLDVHVDAHNQR